MTVPDVADAQGSYGMPSNGFADYTVGVTDPTTDWASGGTSGGAGANQMIADCAAMTHTAARCWARFVGNATTPTLASPNGHDAMWGSSSGVKPVPARTALGTYTLTWPATVTDALGVVKTLNLRKAAARIEGATPYWQPQCSVTAANVVTVYTFDATHAASDLVGVTIDVDVW